MTKVVCDTEAYLECIGLEGFGEVLRVKGENDFVDFEAMRTADDGGVGKLLIAVDPTEVVSSESVAQKHAMACLERPDRISSFV